MSSSTTLKWLRPGSTSATGAVASPQAVRSRPFWRRKFFALVTAHHGGQLAAGVAVVDGALGLGLRRA